MSLILYLFILFVVFVLPIWLLIKAIIDWLNRH